MCNMSLPPTCCGTRHIAQSKGREENSPGRKPGDRRRRSAEPWRLRNCACSASQNCGSYDCAICSSPQHVVVRAILHNRRGDRKRYPCNIFRPCRGSITSSYKPGAHALGSPATPLWLCNCAATASQNCATCDCAICRSPQHVVVRAILHNRRGATAKPRA